MSSPEIYDVDIEAAEEALIVYGDSALAPLVILLAEEVLKLRRASSAEIERDECGCENLGSECHSCEVEL